MDEQAWKEAAQRAALNDDEPAPARYVYTADAVKHTMTLDLDRVDPVVREEIEEQLVVHGEPCVGRILTTYDARTWEILSHDNALMQAFDGEGLR